MFIAYIHSDPYMDFGKKENYSWKFFFQQLGDIATKKLINSSTQYNSFIFGSSRTTSLYACYLNKILPNSNFFHYGNWNETIGGIYNKLLLIDSLGYSIDNVVIYLDTDYTFQGEGKCNISDHYLVTGQNRTDYLITHFNIFYKNLTLDKIKILLGLNVDERIYTNWESDLNTNDPNHNCNNPEIISTYSKIENDNEFVHKIDSLKNTGFLYERPLSQQYKEIIQISDSEKLLLLKLKDLFNKHSTNYYLVITPLYDQYKFNINDQDLVNKMFGDRVYDFSGINWMTSNEYNYPDRKHFQPYISKYMIDSIIKHE